MITRCKTGRKIMTHSMQALIYCHCVLKRILFRSPNVLLVTNRSFSKQFFFNRPVYTLPSIKNRSYVRKAALCEINTRTLSNLLLIENSDQVHLTGRDYSNTVYCIHIVTPSIMFRHAQGYANSSLLTSC